MERLKQRADFLAAAAGVKAHVAGFVLELRERGDHRPPRVGFTVSKKVGTAVERNRVRRRLREIVRGRRRMRCKPAATTCLSAGALHSIYRSTGWSRIWRARSPACMGVHVSANAVAERDELMRRAKAQIADAGTAESAMTDQKNTIIAIALSAVLLIGWQYFFGIPQLSKPRQDQQTQTQLPPGGQPGAPVGTPQAPGAPQAPGQARHRSVSDDARGGHRIRPAHRRRYAAASRDRSRSRARASTICR